MWLILAQGAGGYDQSVLLQNSLNFIDLWEDFWSQNFTINKIKSMQKIAPQENEVEQASDKERELAVG